MSSTSFKRKTGHADEERPIPKVAFLSSRDVCTLLIATFIGVALADWLDLTYLLVCCIIGGVLLSMYVISISTVSVILNLRNNVGDDTINSSLKNVFIISLIGVLVMLVNIMILDAGRTGLWVGLLIFAVICVVTAVLIIMAEFINKNC